MATWECFRVKEDNPQFMSLIEMLRLAKQAGGENHGFRFVQLPFNMYLDQALMLKNQKFDEHFVSFLNSAQKNNIGVFSSVPFMQGRLLQPGIMPEFGNMSAPIRSLQFIRSTPGIVSPLVGQKTATHLNENLEIMTIPPINEHDYEELLKNLTK